MTYDGYEDLRDGLKNLPITWYPAVLILILETVIDKKIFNGRFGLYNVIHKVVIKKGY